MKAKLAFVSIGLILSSLNSIVVPIEVYADVKTIMPTGERYSAVQFNDNAKAWNKPATTIPGMTQIDNIYTVGSYAWAMGNPDMPVRFMDTAIAFYNGKTWSTATTITNMDHLGLAELIPNDRNGLTPTAWLAGGDYTQQVSYFDGKSWSAAVIPSPVFTQIKFLRASGGRAFIIGQGQNGDWYYDSSQAGNPSQWNQAVDINQAVKQKFTPTSVTTSNGQFYIFGYFVDPNTKKQYCYSFVTNGDHSLKTDTNFNTVQSDLTKVYGYADGSSQYVLGESATSQWLLYRHHPEDSWQKVRTYFKNSGYIFNINYEKNGVIISADGFVDTKANPAQWIKLPLPPAPPTMPYSAYLAENGTTIWIESLQETPEVYVYNLNIGKLFKTNVSSVVHSLHFGINPVDSQQVVAFGTDKQNNQVALYYNGQQWITTSIAGMTNIVDQSFNANDFIDHTNPVNNYWLFGSTAEK